VLPICSAAGLEHREQQFLLGARAVRLCLNDHLVCGIHHRNAAVALNDTLVGGELGRFVVGEV
jgi:hypothetical protein